MRLINLKYFFYIATLFLFSIKAISQIPAGALDDISQEEEVEYIKLLCFNDHMQLSAYMPLDTYIEVVKNIDKFFVVDTLKSKGVKGVTFFKVTFNNRDTIQKIYDDLEKHGNYFGRIQYLTGSEYFVHPDLLKHEYIFASSNLGLYKLNGFRLNDFRNFYADCFNTGDCFADKKIKNNRGNLSDKKLIATWSVEGIDLWCMYEKYVEGKKCDEKCLNFNN